MRFKSICKDYTLFQILDNRATLTLFVRLVDLVNNSIKSDYAVVYTTRDTLKEREMAMNEIFTAFVGMTEIPKRDQNVVNRDHSIFQTTTAYQFQAQLNNKKHLIRLQTEEESFNLVGRRNRLLRWCAQASNLDTTTSQNFKPQISIKQERQGPLVKQEIKEREVKEREPPYLEEFDNGIIPQLPYMSQRREEDASEEKYEPSHVGAAFRRDRFQVYPGAEHASISRQNIGIEGPHANGIYKNNYFIPMNNAYQMMLVTLLEWSPQKLTIDQIEKKLLLQSNLDLLIIISEMVAWLANKYRLLQNKTTATIRLKQKMEIAWNMNAVYIKSNFF